MLKSNAAALPDDDFVPAFRPRPALLDLPDGAACGAEPKTVVGPPPNANTPPPSPPAPPVAAGTLLAKEKTGAVPFGCRTGWKQPAAPAAAGLKLNPTVAPAEPRGSASCYWNSYGTQCSHPAQGLTRYFGPRHTKLEFSGRAFASRGGRGRNHLRLEPRVVQTVALHHPAETTAVLPAHVRSDAAAMDSAGSLSEGGNRLLWPKQ